MHLTTSYITSSQVATAEARFVKKRADLEARSLVAAKANVKSRAQAEANLAVLREALLANTSLTKLDLHYSRLTDEGVRRLFTGVGSEVLPNLTRLELHMTEVTDEGVHALVDAITNGALPSLEVVLLHGNKGVKGGDAPVVEAIRQRREKRGEGHK